MVEKVKPKVEAAKPVETPKVEVKTETPVKEKKPVETPKVEVKTETPVKEKKTEEKKTAPKKEVVKKDYAKVYGRSVPISTKYAIEICRFIRGKDLKKAILEMEEVAKGKKAVPMRGEYAHQKGKIMSGKFPVKAGEHFLKMLKSLLSNAIHNGLEEPIISEAIANKAQKPYARFGKYRRKRTHVELQAKQKMEKKE